jgi:hypothetical protein
MSTVTDGALPATPEIKSLSWFDIAFGIVLPILWLAIDPLIMGISMTAPMAYWGAIALGIVALTMARFKTSFAIGQIAVGMLGTFTVAAAMLGTLIVAVVLLFVVVAPLSVIFLVLNIFAMRSIKDIALVVITVLLGFAPLLTAIVFRRHTKQLARRLGARNNPLVAIGVLLFALPLAAHYFEYRWLNPRLEALHGNNPELRLNALRALNEYPLTLGRANDKACLIVMDRIGKTIVEPTSREIDESTRREVERMIGRDLFKKCETILTA